MSVPINTVMSVMETFVLVGVVLFVYDRYHYRGYRAVTAVEV